MNKEHSEQIWDFLRDGMNVQTCQVDYGVQLSDATDKTIEAPIM